MMRANATVPPAASQLQAQPKQAQSNAASAATDKQYEVMTFSQSEVISGYIHDIGKNYLTNNPRRLINVLNTNQNTADKMVAYNPGKTATLRDHEHFLTNRYFELPNYNGGLAESIQDCFAKHFNKALTRHLLIKNISTTTLKEIGIDYLNAHPEPSPWYALIKHNNQIQATQLKECKMINPRSNEPVPTQTPMDLWLFLLYIYETLPTEKGEMARKIENMISNVFGIKFEKMDIGGGSERLRSPSQIAAEIKYSMVELIRAACQSNELQEFKLEGPRH